MMVLMRVGLLRLNEKYELTPKVAINLQDLSLRFEEYVKSNSNIESFGKISDDITAACSVTRAASESICCCKSASNSWFSIKVFMFLLYHENPVNTRKIENL